MLKNAYYYRNQLNAIEVPDNKLLYYALGGYRTFEHLMEKDDWNKIQKVSVLDGNVIGYFSATISQVTNSVSEVSAINFGHPRFTFSKDLRDFLLSLSKFNKINFSVVVGNPIESMYDKYVGSVGGRVVGTFNNDVKLINGRLADRKWYEITGEQLLTVTTTAQN